jgi:hypothetical protein
MGVHSARIGAELRAYVTRAIKMLALEIDRQLRLATPVDTGHARRNWISSVGEPNSSVATDDSAHAAGIQAVLAYELSGGSLWIGNAVPYIRRLNYGHSQQAPAGFVERAVDQALTIVRGKLSAAGSPVDFSGFQSDFRSQVGGDAAGNLAEAYSPL